MDISKLRFSKDHEWVALDGNVATVGISDHAQQSLGDITYVELPKLGKALKAGDALGVVESVKAASDIYAPVGGTVKEVNSSLNDAPEAINQEPYGNGWICKLEGVDAAALDGLLSAEEYEQFCKESN